MRTTADFPRSQLSKLSLTGTTPTKALHTDPRFSYTLYVPDSNYLPQTSSPRLPLIIAIHGTRREYIRDRDALIPLADNVTTACAILSPLFPAGITSAEDLGSYKDLVARVKKSGPGNYPGSILNYDLVLDDMIKEVAQRYPGINTEAVFLSGYSGGGQFVHRYLYVHPEHIVAASIGAPGGVTLLDEALPWPSGTADLKKPFPHVEKVNMESLRAVVLQVYVGDKDTSTKLFEVARQSGNGGNDLRPRTLKAVDLVDNWTANGLKPYFHLVRGVAHSSTECQSTASLFLGEQLQQWWARNPR
jgi:predicted esterase